MNIKQKFKVYCSTNIDSVKKEWVDSLVSNDEPLILEAIASSNSVDLDGDYMTNDCLEDMKDQAIGLSIFLDHKPTTDKIVGSVTEVIETSSDIFKIKFSVLPKYKWYITDLLENGINLGLSIGASVLDYENTDTGWKINKVKLVEISIVGIPANWDTFGTVKTSKELGVVTAKCFNGACKQIIDNLELSDKSLIKKDIEDGEDPQDDGVITEKEVIDLINEACIQLKNEIITEIVTEFNLDGKKYDKPSEEAEINISESETNDKTDSSNDEDKEKNLDMEKEEIIELIKENSLNEEIVKELIFDALKEFKEEDVTETPIIKEEEVEVTKSKEEEDEEGEDEEEMGKSCEDDEEKDKSKGEDEEESSEDEEEDASKSVEIDVKETIDIEELKKTIREEIEEEILKSLSDDRKPVAHEQPKIEDIEKDANGEEKVEKSSGNVMSTRAMAEHLLK